MPSQISNHDPIPYHFTFDAIGTTWHLTFSGPFSDAAADTLMLRVHQRIDVYDQTYSRFRPDSMVSTIARQAGDYLLPADAELLFSLYERLYVCTNGLVTPLIGQVMVDAGYDAEYSLVSKGLRTPPRWQDVIDYQAPTLHVSQPVLLDFGAAGKGYLTDLIASLLVSAGCTTYLIDAGGDIRLQYPELQSIGLEHPFDTALAIGVAELDSGSICGSSGNRRAWGEYTHIISPLMLESPTEIAAVWVVASTGLLADGLATALFFVPPTALAEFQFTYAIVYADLSLAVSAGFPANFFTDPK
jgi:thiamine biosynthesis lipoprotein